MASEEVKPTINEPSDLEKKIIKQEVKPTINEPSDLEKKIIKQIEYYFGNQNLVRDKFLKEKISENDGWVALDCLITFNRLRALSSDYGVIMDALKKSNNGILELDSDGNKLRRSKENPVPDSEDPLLKQQSKTKTLYVKGFPEKYNIDQLEDYFADKGKVIFIKMRRKEDRMFKGSVFVEFESSDDATKFMEMKDLKCGETELVKMHRDEYYKIKEEERKLLSQQVKSAKISEMNKLKKDKKEKENENGDKEVKDEEESERQPGNVLYFSGVGEGTSREDLKSLFGEQEEILWVDFSRGDTEGHIRFKNAGSAQKTLDAVKAANDGKILINEVESTVKVVEGEEEDKYWENLKNAKSKVRQQDRFHSRRGGGRNFSRGRGRGGGRGFGRGRGGGGRDRFRKGNRREWRDKGEKRENVKTEPKDEPQGTHLHFNEDQEKKAIKRHAEKDASEGEPSVKQVKTNIKIEGGHEPEQKPAEKKATIKPPDVEMKVEG